MLKFTSWNWTYDYYVNQTFDLDSADFDFDATIKPLSKLKMLDFVLNKGDNKGTVGYGASVIEWPNVEAIFVIKSIEGAFTTTIQNSNHWKCLQCWEAGISIKGAKKATAFEELNANDEYLEDNLSISSKKITKIKQVLSRSL